MVLRMAKSNQSFDTEEDKSMFLSDFSKLFIFSFCLFAIQCLSYSQSIPFHPHVRKGRLDNGITYFLQSNKEPREKLELRLAIKAGSLQESDDQKGVAHFVEHMAFNGTSNFRQNELIHYIESTGARFGADLNAYTGFEETVYQLQTRTDKIEFVDTAMQILLDWAQNISFDSLETEKERGVVISEWRTRQKPEERLNKQVFPFLYKGSLYPERLPIGDPALLDTIPLERVRDYYDKWYKPENIGVILTGDLPLDTMEMLVQKYFSGLSQSSLPDTARNTTIPLYSGTDAGIFTDPEAFTTTLEVLFRQSKLTLNNLEDYKHTLIVNLFNRMLNERLYEFTQRNQVPFAFAWSGFGNDLANIAQYQYSVTTEPEKLRDALTLIMRFTKSALTFGFLPEELERQKADLLKSAEIMQREEENLSSARLASQLTSHFLQNNPVWSPTQVKGVYEKLLPEITLDNITETALQWLTVPDKKIILKGPEKLSNVFPAPEELISWLAIYDTLQVEPHTESSPNQVLFDEDLPKAEIIGRNYEPETDHFFWKLTNGVKVLIKPTDFKNDEILLTAFSPGGSSIYPDSLYQQANNAAGFVQMSGFEHLDAVALNKMLKGRNVRLGPYISELFEGFSGYCSPEELETLLQMVYLYFTAPGKDEQALQSMKSRQISVLKNVFDNPYYYYADIVRKLKYRNHPRRKAILSPEDINSWTADDCWQVFKDRFADASDFTFVLVGNLDTTISEDLITRYLGNLPSRGRLESWQNPNAPLAEGVIDSTIIRGSAPKARIDLTWHGKFDYADAQERYNFYTVGAYLNTVLRESLREELGGVYGINLNTILLPLPDSIYRITLTFECEPARLEELENAARMAINQLVEGRVNPITLQNVFENQRQERKEGLEKNAFWLQQLSLRHQYGLPLEGISKKDLEKKIENLTPEALSKSAAKYFQTNNRFRINLLPEQ